MNRIKNTLIASSLAGMTAAPAFAMDNTFRLQDNTAEDDTGFYLAVGVSRISAEASAEFDNRTLDFDDTANTFNLRGGYMFTNWIGVEAAYYDFGDIDDTLQDLVEDIADVDIETELDLKGYGFSVVGTLPLRYVDLYLKGGVVKLDGELTARAGGLSATIEEDDTEPFAAVGAEADFGMINFFGEYSRIIDNDDVEVDFVSAGVKFEF